MKDGLMFFCFLCLFVGNLVHSEISIERHDEVINSIKKIEYKVDSLQTKCDSLQNIIIMK